MERTIESKLAELELVLEERKASLDYERENDILS